MAAAQDRFRAGAMVSFVALFLGGLSGGLAAIALPDWPIGLGWLWAVPAWLVMEIHLASAAEALLGGRSRRRVIPAIFLLVGFYACFHAAKSGLG